MTDPNLDLVVADWRDAVHTFLESPKGWGAVQGLGPAKEPIFIALLETMVPAPYTLEHDLVEMMATWRASRERELRSSLSINLFATNDGPPDEALVNRTFMELRNLARDNVRNVETLVGQTVMSLLRDVQEVCSPDADMPTVRPDAYPTRPVEYDSDTLHLMDQPESPAEGVPLAVLEARLAKIVGNPGQQTASGEHCAMRPPPSPVHDVAVPKPPPSPTPSFESFGFKPPSDSGVDVGALDDPLEGNLEPGNSNPPPQDAVSPALDADAPSIELSEGTELDENDELDLVFEDGLNPVPSHR